MHSCRAIIRALASAFDESKLQIIAFDLQVTPDPDLSRVMYIQGDLYNKPHIWQALNGCACVLHMSAAARSTPGEEEQKMHVRRRMHACS